MGMYEEIEILVSISPGSFTITWLKPYHIIRCLCLYSDSSGKEDICLATRTIVAKKNDWVRELALVSYLIFC